MNSVDNQLFEHVKSMFPLLCAWFMSIRVFVCMTFDLFMSARTDEGMLCGSWASVLGSRLFDSFLAAASPASPREFRKTEKA